MSCFGADEPEHAGQPGCRRTGTLDWFLSVLATAPAGFHGKSESSQMQKWILYKSSGQLEEWLYPEYRQYSVEGKKKGVCTSEAA